MKGTRHQALIRGPIRAFLGSMLVLGAMQVAAPVTFAASPPATGCSWGDVVYSADTISKPYAITHRTSISVPPGGTYSQTTTLGTVKTITSSVTGGLSGSIEENFVIEKASLTFHVDLADSRTSTETRSVSHYWSFTNTTSGQRRYVLYTAPHNVSGNYTKWQCTRTEAWVVATSGKYYSFDYEQFGAAACWLTYAAGSAEKLAQTYCP